ncbi:MAG: CPBP family intramembrane metalloprotease [Anaerolineae bacterium]|nr:CPBP family intramembrane metalloprotease [Anaerolineae bacterium]
MGWRLALHLGLLIGCTLIIAVIFFAAMAALTPRRGAEIAGAMLAGRAEAADMLLVQAISAAAITASVYLARRALDRRSFASLGLERRAAGRELAYGFVLAALMMGSIFAAEVVLGWTRITGTAWQTEGSGPTAIKALLWLVIFVIVGWQEELLCRGYWLSNLAEGLGRPLAVLLSAVSFAFLHLNNPDVSWTAILGLIMAGLWFAWATLATGRLWMAIGAHIGWNFWEGTVFGFPVSGLQTFGLIRQTTVGPTLWTGGAFGPEAGLIVLPALALGALAIWGYARRHG